MNIPADVCVLVADYGVGDHYIVAGFAAEIRRRTGLKTWMAGKEKLGFLGSLFPAVERYLNWPDDLAPSKIEEKAMRGGAWFHAHFPGLELMRAVGFNGFHFLDAYRCRFGLRPGAPLTPALQATSAQTEAVTAGLRAAGLDPAEIVLVSPEARTTPTTGVEASFWAALCDQLHLAGLRPLFNAPPGSAVPTGVETLAAPLSDLRAVAQVCAGVCSIRSGFSDLVCNVPVPQVVVYPDVTYWSGSLLEGTTLDRYGLPQPPLEVVVTPKVAAARARESVEYLVAARQLASAP